MRKKCPVAIQEYWNHQDELTVQEDIIMKYDGDIIMKYDGTVIPKSLRKDMLHRVYHSYLGIETCTQRARDIIFWPAMCSKI